MRPICNQCGIYPAVSKGRNVNGEQVWRKTCDNCRRRPYVAFKKDKCDCCGFVPVHRVQLDVDHIDGNKLNNDESNLQTLCANCHRLKTYMNSDWKSKENIELDSLQLVIGFD